MAEEVQSSTETGGSGDKTNVQEMLLELMKEMKAKFQDIRKDREQDRKEREQDRAETKQQFREMEAQFQEIRNDREQDRKDRELFRQEFKQQCEKFRSKINQDLKEDFQKVRSETVPEIPSETVTPTETKVSSAKQRRIRKLRILNSLGIKISKFRKRLTKQIRSARMRKSCDSKVIKYKRDNSTNPNKVKKNAVFRTNTNKNETKVFRLRHEKVNRQQESVFTKTNTCEELTRRLGEQLDTKCFKCKKNFSFQSDQFIEKLTKGSKVKRKSRHKISVQRQSQNCTNCQILQSLFQIGTKVTNSFSKLGTKWPNIGKNRMSDKRVPFKMKNWTKSGSNRASNTKVPLKMKKKEIVKFRKTNVKMKVIFKPVKFGKPKCKIKFGI
jgi:hypothetical protein